MGFNLPPPRLSPPQRQRFASGDDYTGITLHFITPRITLHILRNNIVLGKVIATKSFHRPWSWQIKQDRSLQDALVKAGKLKSCFGVNKVVDKMTR